MINLLKNATFIKIFFFSSRGQITIIRYIIFVLSLSSSSLLSILSLLSPFFSHAPAMTPRRAVALPLPATASSTPIITPSISTTSSTPHPTLLCPCSIFDHQHQHHHGTSPTLLLGPAFIISSSGWSNTICRASTWSPPTSCWIATPLVLCHAER